MSKHEKHGHQRNRTELDRLMSVVKETGERARHATLTGAYKGGEARSIRHFNAILSQFKDGGLLNDPLIAEVFQLIDEDAGYGEVGMACNLLADYLKGVKRDQENEEPVHPYRGLYHLLKSAAEAAGHASLTGHLKSGAHVLAKVYDEAVGALTRGGVLPNALFGPMDMNASLGEIGMACSQLAAYIRDGFDAEDDENGDDPETAAAELKNLGSLVRQAMPDFVKRELHHDESKSTARTRELIRRLSELLNAANHPELLGDKAPRLAEEMQKIAGEIQSVLNDNGGDPPKGLETEMQSLSRQLSALGSGNRKATASPDPDNR
ncbi:MAG: hypothetical protein O3A46_12575 [Candidatus Poribacteria bacterium]|nr:hypothetical protein [Candidatus Poribacteria bacterium]